MSGWQNPTSLRGKAGQGTKRHVRDQLRALEGELVLVNGTWERGRSFGERNERIRALLTNCKVWRYSLAVVPSGPRATPADAVVDHLWLELPRDEVSAELRTKVAYVGRCCWYARRNGSIDLTVRWESSLVPRLLLQSALAKLQGPATTPHEELAILGRLLRELTEPRVLVLPLDDLTSASEVLSVLRRKIELLERSVEAELRAPRGQTSYGVPRRERFFHKGRRLGPAAGFALRKGGAA